MQQSTLPQIHWQTYSTLVLPKSKRQQQKPRAAQRAVNNVKRKAMIWDNLPYPNLQTLPCRAG